MFYLKLVIRSRSKYVGHEKDVSKEVEYLTRDRGGSNSREIHRSLVRYFFTDEIVKIEKSRCTVENAYEHKNKRPAAG